MLPHERGSSMAMASNSPYRSVDRVEEVIRENYPYLVQNLRIFELLTSRHSFRGIISDELEFEIMAKETEERQTVASRFINAFLESKDPGKGRVLKEALEAPEHDLVRRTLFDEDTEESVAHANDQGVLTLHLELLVKNVNCDEMLISMCLSKGLITQAEAEEIRARNTYSGQGRAMYRLLDSVKRSHKFYSSFLKILWDLDYKKLVEEIDKTEYEKLKANDEDGGSIMVNAISFDSVSCSSGLTFGNSECTGDDYILRNSSCSDVEKGEPKDLNVYNILPENNLNGPVSSRTRSKTKLLTQDHPSRDSNGTGTSNDSENMPRHTKKKIFGFQSPQPTSTFDKKVKAGALPQPILKKVSCKNGADPTTLKKYTDGNDHKGTLLRIKQGHTQESSDEDEVSSDRIFNLEYRYPQDHQDVKYRDDSHRHEKARHQAKAMQGTDEQRYRKRDLPKTTNKCQCPCGEKCKDDIQLQVHRRSPLCPLNAMKKGTTSAEIARSKHNFGFQSSKTLTLDFVSDSHYRESQSRLESPPPHRDSPSRRLESPPPFLESPTKRCVSPPPHGDEATKDLTHKQTTRPIENRILQNSLDQHQQRREKPIQVFRCRHCEKSFKTQEKLKSHMEPNDCGEDAFVAKCQEYSGATGKEKKASAENCRSTTLKQIQPPGAKSPPSRVMSPQIPPPNRVMSPQIPPPNRVMSPQIPPTNRVMSPQMPLQSGVMSQPSTEGHRTQTFRCKCDKVFAQKEKLDKHKTEGNCEVLKSSKKQHDSESSSYLNERPAGVFRCSECSKPFLNEQALDRHISAMHK
ncbi:unnamed protein product [Lymnaea stagnalis]|uniref:C2H2-type domain-containing protein n=1 Tax=Lymnaea stagnalis TaxID=6523 RepID=A0AAV2HKT8_LYMST